MCWFIFSNACNSPGYARNPELNLGAFNHHMVLLKLRIGRDVESEREPELKPKHSDSECGCSIV